MKMKIFDVDEFENHLSDRYVVFLNDSGEGFKPIFDSIDRLTNELKVFKIIGKYAQI